MQIVRCSHTGCAACRGPRLVILRCSSTSIFKSAPPPPLSFSLPATTRPLFTTFPRGNSPLQKRLAHASLSLSLSLSFLVLVLVRCHPPIHEAHDRGSIRCRFTIIVLLGSTLGQRSIQSLSNRDRAQPDDHPRSPSRGRCQRIGEKCPESRSVNTSLQPSGEGTGIS